MRMDTQQKDCTKIDSQKGLMKKPPFQRRHRIRCRCGCCRCNHLRHHTFGSSHHGILRITKKKRKKMDATIFVKPAFASALWREMFPLFVFHPHYHQQQRSQREREIKRGGGGGGRNRNWLLPKRWRSGPLYCGCTKSEHL